MQTIENKVRFCYRLCNFLNFLKGVSSIQCLRSLKAQLTTTGRLSMSVMQQEKEKAVKGDLRQLQELEALMAAAIKKVGGKKENDLCRFLPMNAGGYMHHFTLRKMKTQLPQELSKMITRFIMNADRPTTVAPKPRAARGSRKRRDAMTLSRGDLDHILRVARLCGDKDLIRRLTPKKDLRTIKRELISSIRRGEIDQELWSCYCEVTNSQKALAGEECGCGSACHKL